MARIVQNHEFPGRRSMWEPFIDGQAWEINTQTDLDKPMNAKKARQSFRNYCQNSMLSAQTEIVDEYTLIVRATPKE